MNNADKSKNNLKEILSWVYVIGMAAIIAFVLNTFIIANSKIPSESMENTIMTGDRVIGFRLSYLFENPKHGDIIIFKYPDNEKKLFIKRIIGEPGDIVDIKDSKVFVNNVELSEDYIREAMLPAPDMHFEVPDRAYFCMGDNRNHSIDSRSWEHPFVYREKIIAKAIFRYFPGFKMIK